MRAAVSSWGSDAAGHTELVEVLAGRGHAALTVVDAVSSEALGRLWDDGWTPADVIHVTGRRLSKAHVDRAAQLVVADGSSRAQRGQALHPRWQDQLATIAERRDLRTTALEAQVRMAVVVLCLLVRLPGVPRTMPAPGMVSRTPLHGARLDARMLERVRALLAKAESTDFEHEAEALTAKAQELIARHAVDEALLHTVDDVGDPSIRRVLVDDPYANAKASLLMKVAGANRCRAVHSPDFGWVTAFGYDHDLDAVELLSASLLAQATGAMARHGSRRDAAGRSTTRSFRRAFLYGFAHRVGQRLQEATDGQVAAASAAEPGRLLPVLSAREDRLRKAEEAAFPHLVRRSSSVSNGAGWAAGQAAGDLADLNVSAGALRDSPGAW